MQAKSSTTIAWSTSSRTTLTISSSLQKCPYDNGDCYDPSIGRKSYQPVPSRHQEIQRRTRCCGFWAERKWQQGEDSLDWEGLHFSVQGWQGTSRLIFQNRDLSNLPAPKAQTVRQPDLCCHSRRHHLQGLHCHWLQVDRPIVFFNQRNRARTQSAAADDIVHWHHS